MFKLHQTVARGLQHKSLDEKIKIITKYHRHFYIEDFPMDLSHGVLYLERRKE